MHSSAQPARQFKVMVAGASGAGKTTYLFRVRRGAFMPEHVPTVGVEVHPLTFLTTHGPIVFKFWDLAGDPRYAGSRGADARDSRDAYYEEARAQLVFFDLSRPETVGSVLAAMRRHKGLPTVLCGNKADLVDLSALGYAHPAPGSQYYQVSAKSTYNYEKPFLALARLLTGESDLEFAPPLALPALPASPTCPEPPSVVVRAIPGIHPFWCLQVDVAGDEHSFTFVADQPYLYTYEDWVRFTEGGPCALPLATGGGHGGLSSSASHITVAADLTGRGGDMRLAYSIKLSDAAAPFRAAIEDACALGLAFAGSRESR